MCCRRSPIPIVRSTSSGTTSAGRSRGDAIRTWRRRSTRSTEMGISVCVGSNFDGRLRGVVQGLPELGPWIDSLVISSEVGYRKPHPLFFQAACSHLGLPRGRVLCVGDDIENDVRGAIRAGTFRATA